jgi:hypothetical protein
MESMQVSEQNPQVEEPFWQVRRFPIKKVIKKAHLNSQTMPI